MPRFTESHFTAVVESSRSLANKLFKCKICKPSTSEKWTLRIVMASVNSEQGVILQMYRWHRIYDCVNSMYDQWNKCESSLFHKACKRGWTCGLGTRRFGKVVQISGSSINDCAPPTWSGLLGHNTTIAVTWFSWIFKQETFQIGSH